jgi:hypothetical protein
MMDMYGVKFRDFTTQLQVERFFIQHDGYIGPNHQYGRGLFHHYRAAQSLLWPKDDHHRWSDLILKTILEERITVIQGCRDSSKTRTVAKYSLLDYFMFPEETLILMSSTDMRGLELRVWGDLKSLHREACERYPGLPGNPIDAKHGIFTDSLDENGDIRDLRKGIICIPILDAEGNETRSLERFVGVKQKRRRLIADEGQFLPVSYLNVLSNLDQGDFKGVFPGNPLGQKALDRVGEPENGWESIGEPEKTTTWRNKFDGITISLVGTDSPNFDADRPKHYPYLIDAQDVERVRKRYGDDSIEFYSQIKGVRKAGLNPFKVLPKELCVRNGAFTKALWSGEPRTLVMGIDAGFGGDACVVSLIEFGPGAEGATIAKFYPLETIPISLNSPLSAEDQIATAAKAKADRWGVLPANVFFEAGMRATLAMAIAKLFSFSANAILAGGPATERPVSDDLFIEDDSTGQRRLKTCREHYSKFVTELWFSIRNLVLNGQAREFPAAAADQFAEREWSWASQSRYELETKLEYKARMSSSPNEGDAVAIAFEGARRRGFSLASSPSDHSSDDDFFVQEADDYRSAIRSNLLNHA